MQFTSFWARLQNITSLSNKNIRRTEAYNNFNRVNGTLCTHSCIWSQPYQDFRYCLFLSEKNSIYQVFHKQQSETWHNNRKKSVSNMSMSFILLRKPFFFLFLLPLFILFAVFILGTCIDLVNNYTCNCNVGFTGPNCDVKLTNCTDDACYPNVTCFTTNDTIGCGPCPLGFSGDGKNCEGDVAPK